MKNKKILISISIICSTFLVGCINTNSTSNNNTSKYTESNDNLEKETNISNEQSQINENKKDGIKEDKKNEVKTTPLFEKVYVPYTDSIGKVSFSLLVDNIKNFGYKYKIRKPTKEDLGMINIYDNKNNTVSFIFYPIENIEMLSLICYTNGKDEVSISDDFHILKEPKYNTFKKGTEHPNNEVFSIEDQKDFMFN